MAITRSGMVEGQMEQMEEPQVLNVFLNDFRHTTIFEIESKQEIFDLKYYFQALMLIMTTGTGEMISSNTINAGTLLKPSPTSQLPTQ